MKLLAKMRALFTHSSNGETDIPFAAAEIRKNRVYLHPLDNPRKTIRIRASAVELKINPDDTVSESDVLTFRDPEKALAQKPGADAAKGENKTRKSGQNKKETPPYKEPMKTISFRVYQEEYDTVMDVIRSNGYRKAEYLLACILAAKKTSMESTYQRYFDDHNRRKKAEREAAKLYRAQQVQQNLASPAEENH